MAQDLFLRQGKEPEKTIDQELGLTPQIEKPKPPQTIKDFASSYYYNCIKKQHPLMNKTSMESLCACTSVALEKKMTIDEVQAMMTNTNHGQDMRNKMLEHVYAPCMKYPTYDLLHGECLQREKVRRSMRNYQKVCGCMAEGMSAYVSEQAQNIIAEVLMKNPQSIDPLGEFLSSERFNRVAATKLGLCIKKHEFGLP